MSSIYGYFSFNQDEYQGNCNALAYWNRVYGKRHLPFQVPGLGQGGVYLNHISEQVPEQKSLLENQDCLCLLDCVLYNRLELLHLLCLDGNSCSDEELLFELISTRGIDALKDVNGDFAGFIIDKKNHKITLFRDHIGIRPLYYYFNGVQFAFSTDIRGIMALSGLTFTLNEELFYLQASGHNPVSTTDTDLKEIMYLKAATVMEYEYDEKEIRFVSEHQFWELKDRKIRLKNDAAYQKQLRELIESAIQLRIDAAGGSIGCELSGGLDSTVISVLASRYAKKSRFHSWSVDSELVPITKDNDERNIIQAICEQEGITCKYKGKDRKIQDPYRYMFDHAFPPFTNSLDISNVSAWFEGEGIHAVLTGHGGDEGVSHRSVLYEQWYHGEYFSCIKAIYRQTRGESLRIPRAIKRTARMLKEAKREYGTPFHSIANIEEYLNTEYKSRMEAKGTCRNTTYFFDSITGVNRGGLRPRMDNTAFQAVEFGVQYMYPFLDYRVLEYAVSIPRRLYHDGIRSRLIFLETFDDLMPAVMKKHHSKAMPSQNRTGEVSKEYIDQINESVAYHASFLDREFWEPYLDFEKIKEWHLPDNARLEDCSAFNFKLVNLVQCAMLQNSMDKSKNYF